MKPIFPLLLLGLASCQTKVQLSDSWNTLPVLDRVEVEYRGSLLASPGEGMRVHGHGFESLPNEEDPGMVHEWSIKFGFVETSAEAVARLFQDDVRDGAAGFGGARIVPHEAMQQTIASLIESGDGVMISDPRLLVLGKTRASVVVSNQTAFIRNFNFELTDQAILVDPEVGVFSDGLLADVIPGELTEDGDALLQFHVVASELVEMKEVESSYPYRGQSITLQVPVFTRQDVSGTLRIGPDEAAILPALVGRDGKRLLVIVRMDPTDRGPVNLTEMQKQMPKLESSDS